VPSESVNPWTTLSSAERYDNPWIRVVEHQVLNPAGKPGIYGTVHFKNLAIGVVPVDAEGCTYLVGQYRYPLGRYSWEIPEGGGRHAVDPLVSAQRELIEEVGLVASGWQEILRLDLSNSVTDERGLCYLAWDLEQRTAEPEDTELLQIRRLPLREAASLAVSGEITDSLSVAALLRVELMVLTGALPAPLRPLFPHATTGAPGLPTSP
jgi:8-oxo-dGTP pyrophosphatase MutT (NUDIX family)